MHPNISLEEHALVNITCLANVGNQNGILTIWKLSKTLDQNALLMNSSLVDKKTENCKTMAYLSLLYNLSRHDNGATFRCTSQNGHSKNLSREVESVEVFCKFIKFTFYAIYFYIQVFMEISFMDTNKIQIIFFRAKNNKIVQTSTL